MQKISHLKTCCSRCSLAAAVDSGSVRSLFAFGADEDIWSKGLGQLARLSACCTSETQGESAHVQHIVKEMH